MTISRKSKAACLAGVVVSVALASGWFGVAVGRKYQTEYLGAAGFHAPATSA